VAQAVIVPANQARGPEFKTECPAPSAHLHSGKWMLPPSLHTGSFTLHILIVCEDPQSAGEETEVWAGWQ
jgi:hypothetical protein